MKFYFCRHCGNIITHFKDSGVRVVCCGEKMQELVPGTTDGATEKHVPVVKIEGNKVTVRISSVEHPMVEAHYIEWIVLETRRGFQKKELKPGEKPEAEFLLPEGEAAVAAYEYCNLHGLWKAEI
ncbi:MAG: desulfoferrodoxin family protein [Candidatus Cryptobacteroides sp.]|jgi:superoxide reductase